MGVQVLCADTEEEAARLAASRNLARIFSITGRADGVPTPEDALAYSYQPNEWAFMQQYQRLCADGNPQQVKEKLQEIAEQYQTPDLSVVTICHGFDDRVRSDQLVAEACGIKE